MPIFACSPQIVTTIVLSSFLFVFFFNESVKGRQTSHSVALVTNKYVKIDKG